MRRQAAVCPILQGGGGMIETLKARVNGDEALVRRGRFLTTTFLLEVGQTSWLISIFEGKVLSVTPGPFVMPSSSFALRAPQQEWEKFWSSRPHVDPYYDLNFLHRPDVHGGEGCAAIVSGLVGPDAPDDERWETLWHYMQGGPGVFKGDLYFYKLDGDIRGRVAQIDTRRCPLFLLSGEYDYSCTPEETLAVANSVPGSEVTIMKGLGHFPMSENPAEFLKHLLPVLEKIGRT